MAYTLLFVADFGPAQTGLTLNAQLYDDDGTPNGAAITTGFVEVDSTSQPGVYSYKHTAIPDGHRGTFGMYKASDPTIRVPFSVNPEEAERVDAAVSTLATAAALSTVSTVVDAIKAVTDNLPDSGALNDLATILAGLSDGTIVVGDIQTGVVDADALAADAVAEIVAALNDPTAAAVAAAVWAYATRTLTQSAASVASAVAGDKITVYRGTTWSISLTGLGSLANYDTVYFTAKESERDTDANAILQVKNAASGLVRFNKAAPLAGTNGTITVDNAANGDITITVQEEETQNAPLVPNIFYDVKGVDSDGNVDLVAVSDRDNDKGFNVEADITRAIT